MRTDRRWQRMLGLLTVWILLAAIASLTAWLIVQPMLQSSARAFREDCLVYAMAFVNSIHAWQATGGDSPLTPVAQYALVSGMAYAQVEVAGERLLDVQQPHLEPPPPFDATGERIAGMATRFIGGLTVIDIVLPYTPVRRWGTAESPEGNGFVRIGVDASAVTAAAARLRQRVGWIAGAGWMALCGGFVFADRRLRHRRADRLPTQDPRLVSSNEAIHPRQLAAGYVILFLDEGRLQVGVRSVEVTPKQQRILGLLLSEPGRAFSDAEILAAVWPASPYANSRDVKQYIYLIRKRLTAAGLPANDLLANVPGLGYRIAYETIGADVDPEIDPPSIDDHRGASQDA